MTNIYIFNFHGIDSFIQKTKQRYNNTRTLTSRLNLSEMSEDLHNNPPFQISQSELGPENNTDVKTYKTGGKYAVCFYCRTIPVLSHLEITNGSLSIVNTIHTECYGTAKRYLALNACKKQVKKKHIHACNFFSKALKKCGVERSSVCMEQSFVLPFV